MLFSNITSCRWIFSCTSQYQITVQVYIGIQVYPFIGNVNIILLTETQFYNQEPNMENRFENHQLVMHNDRSDLFKNLAFLKESNVSHSILPYNSILFAEFIVSLLPGFEKVSVLLIEIIILMTKTSYDK